MTKQSEKEKLIRTARKTAGLTQRQAADRLGWTQSAWAQLENGDPEANTVARLRKVAEALECPLADLIDLSN